MKGKRTFLLLVVVFSCVSCGGEREKFGNQMQEMYNNCTGERTMTMSAGDWNRTIEVTCTDIATKK